MRASSARSGSAARRRSTWNHSAGWPTTSGWRTRCTSTTPRSRGSLRRGPASRIARRRTPGSVPGSAGRPTYSRPACRLVLAWMAPRRTRRARCSARSGRRCWSRGPPALTVRQSLELATLGGARLLGRSDELGSLETGKLADIALWRVDGPAHAGIADPVAGLVLGARPPLQLLIVDGEIVVEHDRVVTVDERAVTAAAARSAAQLAVR